VSEFGAVLYLDPSLGAAGGHHEALARGFADLLGGGVDFAGAKGGALGPLVEGNRFLPLFAHRIEDAFRISRYGLLWVGRGAAANLARWLSQFRPGRARSLPPAPAGAPLDTIAFKRLFEPLGASRRLRDLLATPERWRAVICIGVDPATLCALHDASAALSRPGAPDLHLVFMYPEHEFLSPRTEAAYFQLLRDMETWPRPPHLYAELGEHADDLQQTLGRPVRRQILPYRLRPPPPVAANGRFIITVLGAGRADKAFDALPEIVAATAARDGEIQFRIQRPAPRQRLEQYVRALARERAVTLLPAMLDAAAYDSELARAHVLLLAYDPLRYARRGSGVLIDALVAGKPVVCAAGTALAGELAHGNGLSGTGGAEIAAALVEARSRYPDLLSGAARARAEIVAAIAEGPLFQALGAGVRP
jgi:glycosyltransferase involved in cell wall biosynthesis